MHTLKIFIEKKTPIILTGVSFCKENIGKAKIGDLVKVNHEHNEYDDNALRVSNQNGQPLGFIPKKIAARIVEENTKNISFVGHVNELRTHKGEVMGLSIQLDKKI
jgi:hypothetical protein